MRADFSYDLISYLMSKAERRRIGCLFWVVSSFPAYVRLYKDLSHSSQKGKEDKGRERIESNIFVWEVCSM